ncbi:MAG: 1-acyl-sn-glycerol-3-phosphate acyltransferase [Nonomuraea sp.]|nr:1-acyl-sn-glycerol-3-phosphate acyltransferase [Nonomuraea sp.]NUP69492.1 1-acyl-sn-glycerol-3-phosphate acyltransferase [Nonomuraea sp.]NUP83928.1 1-acyl-sn-glycerol-3-phosphate acyltransferase [Nonomuraea sp.]NUT12842.1 1-acyl-sn-glycerol-3-phosphate acyltransferase [Nonomuraea sp.]
MSRPTRPSRFWETLAVVVVKPLSWLLVKRDWRRGERIPRTGGLIIATNHLSWTDPVLLSHFLFNNGRWPVILAKSALFKVPFLGRALNGLLAIPVERGSAEAARSLKISSQRLRDGAAILFYPEGTCTRDPALWPMVGKTGAARLALESGAKVIPIAHWGAHELLPYGATRPRLFPRKTFHVSVGPPVDLSKYEGKPLQATVLREATADIMAAITAQLAELRGEKAPETPYDPAGR